MALKHEQERLERDLKLDDMLQSETGRAAFWNELGEQAKKDSLVDLLESTLPLAGDVIECGVYRGSSLFRICRALKAAGADKKVYACDSFEGFPDERVTTRDTTLFRPLTKLRAKFRLASDVPDRIQRFAGHYGVPVQVVKGYFSDTLPTLALDRLCFIHLDVDIYESYKECLGRLYPLLTPGGVVVFDDYGSSKWPGAKRAVDEFFGTRPGKVERSTVREDAAWFVRKPLQPGG
jgi:O-methyltransferase